MERTDEQAAQARTITATVEKRDDQYPIVVANHGTLPVTDVVFHTISYRGDGQVQEQWFPALEHTFVERTGDGGLLLCSVLGGGNSFTTSDTSVNTEIFDYDPLDVMVDISFMDADGRRWRRIGNGHPVRMLDAPTQPTMTLRARVWWSITGQ